MPLDLLLDGWLGLCFAWCARERVRAEGPWAQPSFTLVGLFVAMILAPCALYFYLAHPAWTWLYLVDPARVPRIAIVPILSAYGAAVIGAYYGGAWLLRTGKEKVLLGAMAGGAIALLTCAFLLRGRLLHYGSYADWQAGRVLPLADVKLGYVLIAVVIGVAGAAIFLAWELRRDGRRAATR